MILQFQKNLQLLSELSYNLLLFHKSSHSQNILWWFIEQQMTAAATSTEVKVFKQNQSSISILICGCFMIEDVELWPIKSVKNSIRKRKRLSAGTLPANKKLMH